MKIYVFWIRFMKSLGCIGPFVGFIHPSWEDRVLVGLMSSLGGTWSRVELCHEPLWN